MVPLLTELLGLAGIDVESYEVCEDGLILDVEVHEQTFGRIWYVDETYRGVSSAPGLPVSE